MAKDGPTHEHKFVIPVEWIYEREYMGGDDGYSVKAKAVTKLRCECGEEIGR